MCIAQGIRRQALHQPILYRPWSFARSEPGAVADPEDVGVHGHRCFAEDHVQHHVGGLASNAGQRLQRGAVVRHHAAMVFQQQLREGIMPGERLCYWVLAR